MSDKPDTTDIIQTARFALYSIGDSDTSKHYHYKHRRKGQAFSERCIVCTALEWLEWWLVCDRLKGSGVSAPLEPPKLPDFFVALTGGSVDNRS